MENILNAALEYIELGIPVFPCKIDKTPATEHGCKDATTNKEQIIRWFKDTDYNIGIPTGRASGILVVDCDGEAGKENFNALSKKQVIDTPMVSTGNGFHVYFKMPDREVKNSAGSIADGLDVRGDGGYVIAPPSAYESGTEYSWYGHGTLEALTEAPEWFVRAIDNAGKGTAATLDLGEPVQDGKRNDTLFSLARSNLKHGVPYALVLDNLKAINEEHFAPPMDVSEVEKIAESAANYGGGNLREYENTSKEEELGTLYTDVESEEVTWLWDCRIPYGKLTMLDGDAGLGKSVMTLDLAARLSTGRSMPDGELGRDGGVGVDGVLGGVVILSAEDGNADTIKPRLEAAGADCGRVLDLSTIPDSDGDERLLSIPDDIDKLERGIKKVNAKLVIIDPLVAFMSADSNKDNEVRKALSPLKLMAERTGVAVVMIRHINKSKDMKALYRGGGSVGIIGAARSGLLVADDKNDPDLRVLAATKGNLAPKATSLTYKVITAPNNTAAVEWHGETTSSADDLLDDAPRQQESEQERGARFLRETLADGPMLATEVKELSEEAGIAPRTLDRAKIKAGVTSRPHSGKWWWSIQERQDCQERQDRQEFQQEELGVVA